MIEADYSDLLPSPPSDRYSVIGQLGEPIGLVLARNFACRDCGALVANPEVHDRWHDKL